MPVGNEPCGIPQSFPKCVMCVHEIIFYKDMNTACIHTVCMCNFLSMAGDTDFPLLIGT